MLNPGLLQWKCRGLTTWLPGMALDLNNFMKNCFPEKVAYFTILQMSLMSDNRKQIDSYNWCDVTCHVAFGKFHYTFVRAWVNKVMSYYYGNSFMGSLAPAWGSLATSFKTAIILDLQNIETAHTTQQQQPTKWKKNGQKTKQTFLKEDIQLAKGVWKDAQHH